MSKFAKFALDKVGAPDRSVCPCCRRPLPEGAAYRAMVRYGDGDDLYAYTKTKGEALAVLIGWRDDELGTSFFDDHTEFDYLDAGNVALFASSPVHFVGWADSSSDFWEEVYLMVEDDLMNTPLVGRVEVDSLLDDGVLTI